MPFWMYHPGKGAQEPLALLGAAPQPAGGWWCLFPLQLQPHSIFFAHKPSPALVISKVGVWPPLHEALAARNAAHSHAAAGRTGIQMCISLSFTILLQ